MLLANFNGLHKLKKFQHIGIKYLWTEIGAVPRRRHYSLHMMLKTIFISISISKTVTVEVTMSMRFSTLPCSCGVS